MFDVKYLMSVVHRVRLRLLVAGYWSLLSNYAELKISGAA